LEGMKLELLDGDRIF